MPEGFDAGSLPEGFDPASVPEGFGFGGTGMPEGFGGGDMPDMGSFTPPGQSDSDTDKSGEETAEMPRDTQKEVPSSFSGMPGQSSPQKKISNLVTCGICLVFMIGAVLAVHFLAGRKHR